MIYTGLKLLPNKIQPVHFRKDVHLSAAILDIDSVPTKSKKTTQVLVAKEGKSEDPFEDGLLIANLCRQNSQFPLDIGFSEGERVCFAIKGVATAIVHLSGYEIQEENIDQTDPVDSHLAIINERSELRKNTKYVNSFD